MITIKHDSDAYYACLIAKEISALIGFGAIDTSCIVTATSELANNIIKHTKGGELIIEQIIEGRKNGIMIVAQDKGMGIPNWENALKDGFSTKNTLGLGLPGVVRLMDDFEYDKNRKVGIKITTRKWM